MSHEQALIDAVGHHRAGRLAEAERLYRAILEAEPGHAPASHNLGVLTLGSGGAQKALPLFLAALNGDPRQQQHWFSYIDALIQAGRPDDAWAVLDQGRARGLKGAGADGLAVRLATLAPSPAEMAAALAADDDGAAARTLTIRFPGHGFGWKALGAILRRLGRRDEALAALERAARLAPDDPEPHNILGNSLREAGRLDEAETRYRRAVALKPDFAEAHGALSLTLGQLGRADEAEASRRRALEINPNLAATDKARGAVLRDHGRLAESEAAYRRALQIDPDDPETHHNLGNTLRDLRRFKEAAACYAQAVRIRPDLAEAHFGLADALWDQDRLGEAEMSYRRALELKPGFPQAHANLANLLRELCRFPEAAAVSRRLLEIADDVESHSGAIFSLSVGAGADPQEHLERARAFGRLLREKGAAPYTAWTCDPAPERLKVGLVSGDLKDHPVGYFLESLLAGIDPARIELIAYPTGYEVTDLTRRIQPAFGAWRPLYGLDDDEAARTIHADGVHVLLDLAGHTARNRLAVFARRPAPVQASWLGYFATTGVEAMDHLIGDPYVTPADETHHFTERPWPLAETYLCFTPPDVAVDVGPLPALSGQGVTFGCFNNLGKMTDAVVAVWSRILLAKPDSRLFLKTRQLGEARACAATRDRFAAHGVDPDRLALEGGSSRADLLAAYNRVDVALDPFPYPGGTTTIEGLWMGVPFVTRRGDRFLSHLGEGIAHNAGLADWIAADDDDYVAKAVAHTADLQALAALRAGLRMRVLASPLFDAPRFARHFEDALLGMWTRRVREEPKP